MRKRLFMRFLMFFRFTTYSWPGVNICWAESGSQWIYILAMRFIPIVILLSAGSDPWFELVVHCCYFLVFCRPCKFLGDYNCPGKVLFAEIVSVFGNGWIVITAVEVIGSGQVGRCKACYMHFRTLSFDSGGSCDSENVDVLMFKSSGFTLAEAGSSMMMLYSFVSFLNGPSATVLMNLLASVYLLPHSAVCASLKRI